MTALFDGVRDMHVDASFPPLARVHQHINPPRLDDPARAVAEALGPALPDVTAGMRVAITAGSRGVANMPTVIKTAVELLRTAGADPFVVPAMGSHGGATTDGQRGLLADLGIDEASVGAPILATMETVELGKLPDGPVVHLDANAAAADRILLVNRIKPHTSFRGDIESGLAKIAAVGLGKRRGAEAIHAFGPADMQRWIPAAYAKLAGTGKVLGGLGLVEGGRHELARVAYLAPDEVGAAGEHALLEEARRLLPRLPFDHVDVLIVDSFGKDKSGAGIDPNVVGRMGIPGIPELPRPHVTNITAHHLTPASHGNATGIGLADFAPLRVIAAIDLAKTYTNGLTAGLTGVRRTSLPVVLPTDRDVVAAAIRTCGRTELGKQRVVRIHDTLNLEWMLVSSALTEEAHSDPALEIVDPAEPMSFDSEGDLDTW